MTPSGRAALPRRAAGSVRTSAEPLSDTCSTSCQGNRSSGVLNCHGAPIPFVVRVIPTKEREREDVMTMMFYDMTRQYQAERIKSAAELRRADADIGMMAAEVSRLWRRLIGPVRGMRAPAVARKWRSATIGE